MIIPFPVPASESCTKARQDRHRYDPRELAYEKCQGVYERLMQCAHLASLKTEEPHFFVVMLICTDINKNLQNLEIHKYYPDLFLPEPRPSQLVCMYNKALDRLIRIWSLPSPLTMARASSLDIVPKEWILTKSWCDAFYRGDFHCFIRKQAMIDDLTRKEFSELHGEELAQFRAENSSSISSDSLNIG